MDSLTGKLVPTQPYGASYDDFDPNEDPDHWFNPRTKVNFSRQADGSWINSKTGRRVYSAPYGSTIDDFDPNEDPDHWYNPRTKRNFHRVPCPPPPTSGAKAKPQVPAAPLPSTPEEKPKPQIPTAPTPPTTPGDKPSSEVPSTSWIGGFGGVHVAGTWTKVNTREFLHATGAATNDFNDSDNALGGGAHIGYNWVPKDGCLLLGALVDVTSLDGEVRHMFPSGSEITSTLDTVISVQGRVGFFPEQSVLLYGLGGVSFADQDLHIDFRRGVVSDDSRNTTGITLGAGGEWMLEHNPVFDCGRGASLFLEYQHTWWDKAGLNTPAASPRFDYTWERDTDVVKGGFRTRF